MKPPHPSFADALTFLRSMPSSSLTYTKLRSRFPSKSVVLRFLVEADLIAFPNACFEFVDKGPEEAQHGSLANRPKRFASHLHDLSKVAAVGFWT